MLSRVADSLYWMSRYLERAENTVRLLNINMDLMLDKSHTSSSGAGSRYYDHRQARLQREGQSLSC